MSTTLRRTGGDRPWLTLIDMPFAKQSTKEVKAANGLYEHYKDKSKAAGERKPNESQKSKALWKMKAARDNGEDFYDPERKDNIWGRNRTRLELESAPQTPNCGTGQSLEVSRKAVLLMICGSG